MATQKIKPFTNQNGYTTFNNYILDHIMPNLAPNSWKVLCFIIRKTEGWNKDIDSLSFSQIMDGTGIKNRTTVSNAIKDLETSKYIIVNRFDDTETSNEYKLNTDLEIDDPGTEIVLAQRKPSTENVLHPSTEIVPTKESLLNKELSKDNGGKPPGPKTIVKDAFLEITKLKWPYKKTDQGFWWSEIGEILYICNKDPAQAIDFIKQSFEYMTSHNLSVHSPRSVKGFCGQLASGQSLNGASKNGQHRQSTHRASKPKTTSHKIKTWAESRQSKADS